MFGPFGPFVYGAIAFVLVASAVYVGTLRALDVYFDDEQDSWFLEDNTRH
ncbi:MAG: hypothetical protein IH933_11780 [Euryarchaeota archaeon]|jgi:hypothetical protein|nr:hypothetical protein [Euryarchaeota archaeon]